MQKIHHRKTQACHFLLNYAELHRMAKKVIQTEHLPFSFELCNKKFSFNSFYEFLLKNLLFSFELCVGVHGWYPPGSSRPVLLLSFECCIANALKVAPGIIASALNLLFSFECCGSGSTFNASVDMPFFLLFSFECCTSGGNWGFACDRDSTMSCYFLLNVACGTKLMWKLLKK